MERGHDIHPACGIITLICVLRSHRGHPSLKADRPRCGPFEPDARILNTVTGIICRPWYFQHDECRFSGGLRISQIGNSTRTRPRITFPVAERNLRSRKLPHFVCIPKQHSSFHIIVVLGESHSCMTCSVQYLTKIHERITVIAIVICLAKVSIEERHW